jgi:hypothetical protein
MAEDGCVLECLTDDECDCVGVAQYFFDGGVEVRYRCLGELMVTRCALLPDCVREARTQGVSKLALRCGVVGKILQALRHCCGGCVVAGQHEAEELVCDGTFELLWLASFSTRYFALAE